MPEHRIRLRGGWWCHGLSDSPSPAARQPATTWDPGQPGPVRLVRQFGCPAINRSRETVVLRLEDVPGLVAVQMNGCPVELPATGSGIDWP